jgi:hypothetical protein
MLNMMKFCIKKIRQKMGMGNILPNFLFAMFGVNAWYGGSF